MLKKLNKLIETAGVPLKDGSGKGVRANKGRGGCSLSKQKQKEEEKEKIINQVDS